MSPQDDAAIEFFMADDGRPERMEWKVGGQTFKMPRVGPKSQPAEAGTDQ